MFVDTSAWVALIVEGDEHHERAKKFLSELEPSRALITTDDVFDETITRIRRLAGHRIAVRAGELIRASALAQIVPVTPDDFERAWSVFRKHEDKVLSFTDCTSVAVMERMRIRTVFAFDEDFKKLGLDLRPAPR